jgi:hypothetical protein
MRKSSLVLISLFCCFLAEAMRIVCCIPRDNGIDDFVEYQRDLNKAQQLKLLEMKKLRQMQELRLQELEKSIAKLSYENLPPILQLHKNQKSNIGGR